MLREHLHLLLIIGISLLVIPVFAQSDYCAAEQVHQQLLNNNPALLLQEQEAEQAYFIEMNGPRQKVAALYTIPVVVHIIHNNGPENISDATVLQGIQDMNDAFANIGYYDQGTGVDTEIEFCLAIRDPDGNATTGINRVVSPLTNMTLETDDLAVKDLSRWNPYDYLNIWLVAEICSAGSGCGVAGYAYFPAAAGSNIDGTVSEADLFGSSPLNSFVSVHEVGHYLGLKHTFQGGCANNDCLTDGDCVCDTPPDNSTAGVPCGVPVNTCTTDANSGFPTDQDDMTWNYMDYGWSCPSAFSAGQRDRMQFFLTGARSSLLNSPGCLSPCTIPITANISASSNSIDIGQTVNFNNTTTNATNYEWTIDGVPFATSMNSSYPFNSLGTFEIIMTATNADPNCFASDTVYVEVNCPATADFSYTLNGSDATFTNNSIGASSYTWTVDDGTGSTVFSTAANPNYTFSGTGWFAVCLEAETALCNDADCQYIFINDGGTVDFEIVNYYGTATGNDYFTDMVYDEVNKVFFGVGSSDVQGVRQATITKLDNCGEVMWTKHYYDADGGLFRKGLMMQDGNLIVLGGHNISGVSRMKVIAKISSADGSIIWMNTLEYPSRALGDDFFASIGDPAGETYYFSSWLLTGGSSDDHVVIKIDNSGNVLYQKQYAWNGDDQMQSFPVFGGGFAACGAASGYGWDATLSIFDTNGDYVAGKVYNNLPGAITEFLDGVQTPDGGFMLVGNHGNNGTERRPMIARIDENYNLQWMRVEQDGYISRYGQISRDVYGDYYTMGRADVGGTVYPKVSKFDENYNYLWTKYLGVASDAPASANTFSLKATGTSPDKIMLVDYGTNTTFGLGARDAFLAVLDTALNSCITEEINPAAIFLQSGNADIQPTETTFSTILGTYTQIGNLNYTIGEICTVSCPEICDNGLDDDDDGLVDCDDPECDCPDNDCENTFLQLIGSPSLDEEATAIADLPFGGFILGGSRGDSTLIVRMGSDGSIVWSRTFDFVTGDEQLRNMIIDSDGFIIGVGFTTVSNPRINYAFKYDHLSDNIIWSNTMSNPNRSAYWDIIEKAAGDNYFVTGQSANNNSPGLGCDGLVLELDRNTGVKLAEYNYNFGSCETFQAAKIYNNQLYVTGRYNNAGGGTAAMRGSVSQLDFAGNEIWSRMYLVNTSTPARLYSTDLLVENDEIFVVSHGDMSGTAANDITFQFYKTDINGNIIWAKEYDTPAPNNDERPTELRSLPDGFLILGTYASAADGKNGFLIKTDKQGVLQWSKEFPLNNGDDSFHDLIIKDDFIYIAGSALGSSGTGQDILLLKLNLDGEVSDDCPIGNTFTVTEINIVNPFDALRDLIEFNINISLTNNPKTATPSPLALEEMICETPCPEICDNSVDDDGDGLIDCDDPDCDCTECEDTFLETIGTNTANERGYVTVELPLGGFMIGGSRQDSLLLVRVDNEGAVIWSKTFKVSTAASERIHNMMIDSEGNVLGVGYATTTSSQVTCLSFKYNYLLDNMLWVNYMPSPTASRFLDIIEPTPGGNYLVAGFTGTNVAPGWGCDNLLLEIDRNTGAMLAEYNYTIGSCEFFQHTILDNGALYATGRYTMGGSSDKMRPAITKLDLSGNELWSKIYLVNPNATARLYPSKILIENNEIFVVGHGDINGTSTANISMQFFKTDIDGNIQWAKEYDISTGVEYEHELISVNNGFLIAGEFDDGGDRAAFLLKTNQQGVIQWAKKYDSPGDDDAFDVLLKDGLIYLTGTFENIDQNILFARLDANGEIEDGCIEATDITVTETSIPNPYEETIDLSEFQLNLSLITPNISTSPIALAEETVCENFCDEICDNTIDDDGDGLPDCLDPDCECDNACLPEFPPLDLGLDITVCENGVYTFNAGSGYATYEWQDGATDSTYTAYTAGMYWVEVSDGCGNFQLDTIALLIDPISGIDLADTTICAGDSVTLSIGTFFDNFTWIPPDGLNCVDCQTVIASPNTTTTYTVVGTTLLGCVTVDTVTVTIEECCAMEISLPADSTLCTGNTASLAVNFIQDGTQPYIFNWSNGANTPGISNLGVGIYSVTVTDTDMCTATASTEVTQAGGLSANANIIAQVACFGECNGSASAIPTGGTPPLSYQWDNNESTATATALCAGIHNVTITDVNGCQDTAQVTITEPPQLNPGSTITNPVSCFGGNDGTASTSGSGGTPPYTFNWNTTPAQSSATATGLSAGAYTVTITDANNCAVQINVTITQPASPLTATISGTNPTCGNDGSVSIVPTGGTPGYTYIWNNGATTSSLTNLGAGIYQVIVSDANSCSTTASIELTQPVAMTATAIGETLSCNDSSDGNISLTVNNGTAPYTYQWDNGAGTNQNPSGLGAGIYTVTITDVNMCTATAFAEITAPAILSATASGQDALCFGSSDGQGIVTAIGGTAPYTYLWDNNETTNPAIFLNAGQHEVTITDLNGCQTEVSLQINNPNPLIPSLFSTPTSCFGGNDGSATVSASGGTPPYTYNWNTTPAQTGATAIDLPAGVVQVIITDANGCNLPPINVTITQPDQALFASVSNTAPLCNGGTDGSATVVPTGGVASYTYQWSSGAVGQTAFDLQAGNYSVTVTDANGCTYIDNANLADPAPILAVLTADDVICYNDENGSILVEMPSGGTAPYAYSLDGETFVPSDFFGGLAAGNYTVYVQDVNACENQFATSINQPFELLVDLGVDITLELSDSVQLFAQTNTLDSLTYSWTPDAGLSCTDCPNPVVQTFENTGYEVMVTDTNGCTAISEITIDVNKDRNIYIPNVFSPNFDGVNDIFMIYGGQGVGQIDQFSVYDRWGELLFEAKDFPPNDSSFGWDGTFKNKELNPNVFVYYIEVTFVDGISIPYKGDVTLVK